MAWLEKRKRGDGTRVYRLRDVNAAGKKFTANKDCGRYIETAEEIKKKYEDNTARRRAGVTTPDTAVRVALETWLKSKKRPPSTASIYRRAVEAFINHSKVVSLGDISSERVNAWREDLQEGALTYSKKPGGPVYRYKAHGIRIMTGTLRTFTNYLRGRGWLHVNPFQGISVPVPKSPRRDLTVKEVVKFIRACRVTHYRNTGGRPPRDLAKRAAWFTSRASDAPVHRVRNATNALRKLILFGLYTGMRIGEVLAARWDQIIITEEGRWVLVVDKTKTHLDRVVPIHRRLRNILGKRNLLNTGAIFPGWTQNRVNHARRRALVRAGLGRVRYHDLRHNFVKFFLKSKGGTGSAKGITGHQSTSAFDIYANIENASDLAEAMDRMKIK